MRHRVAGKKLSRDYDHRRALRRNLMVALIQNEKIKTTEAKADLIRAEMEKLVTKAKQGLAHPDPARAVHARRIVLARLGNNRDAMLKLFDELAPRFADRPGGYTRTYKLGLRKGDAAPMVQIEFLPAEAEEEA
ncbi:MAG: 50S ribosomal protein L17 [Chloroflexota bacterium]|nr:50S ribosomal protein L17 [Chloroflexota bacterium]NOG62765.1 50S ribosomal protein L17 [Chloroflexota bacterium]GIK63027.1 MAG: 50S ribosomal protein L17 [Chloroflexota bacterium]